MPLLDVTLTVSSEERPDRWDRCSFTSWGSSHTAMTEKAAHDRIEVLLSALVESFDGDVERVSNYL